jgi:hypothetical protein
MAKNRLSKVETKIAESITKAVLRGYFGNDRLFLNRFGKTTRQIYAVAEAITQMRLSKNLVIRA